MFDRFRLGALLFICLVVPFIGCGSSTEADSILVTPATVNFGGVGLTAQLTATATIGHGTHPSTTQDVTNLVTWTTGSANVATVSASGLVTSTGPGSIQVTASMNGFTGLISSSSTVTVTVSGGGGGGTNTDVTSLTVIPGSQSVASPGQTGQFIAIGTTASGATENLTSQVVWGSSSTPIATVCTAGSPAPCIASTDGLATGVAKGTTTITALYTNVVDHTVVTGTATFTVVGGVSEQITALSIIPGTQALSATGQTGQFMALGTSGTTGLIMIVTNSPQLTWTSSIPTVATISTYPASPAGLATGVSVGSSTITAQWTNTDNSVVTATATVGVSAVAAAEPLLSIDIVPAGITVSNKGMTGQFLAFGTYSTTPTIRDLTNQVTWISTEIDVASIDSGGVAGEIGGLATAMGYTGNSVIYAEATNKDGTVVLSNPETFTCSDLADVCDQTVATPQFATVTVFVEGENTSPTGEFVTAPSDTGTPNLIHCGPDWTGSGGQVCTGIYETGSTIVLTENLPPGSTYFGGWSYGDGIAGGVGCQELNLATSTTCTLKLIGDTSMGVIFY